MIWYIDGMAVQVASPLDLLSRNLENIDIDHIPRARDLL